MRLRCVVECSVRWSSLCACSAERVLPPLSRVCSAAVFASRGLSVLSAERLMRARGHSRSEQRVDRTRTSAAPCADAHTQAQASDQHKRTQPQTRAQHDDTDRSGLQQRATAGDAQTTTTSQWPSTDTVRCWCLNADQLNPTHIKHRDIMAHSNRRGLAASIILFFSVGILSLAQSADAAVSCPAGSFCYDSDITATSNIRSEPQSALRRSDRRI